MSINGQMQNLSVDDGSTSKRPSGIPPSHPNYPPSGPFSQFGASKMGSGPQNLGGGPAHSRSLSQSSFFSFDHLPPLSPSTFREASQNPGESRVSNDLVMEERASNSQGSSFPSGVGVGVVGGGAKVQLNEGLPPRKGHRRSNSDVTVGVGSMDNQMFVSRERAAQLVLKQEADDGEGERKLEGEVADDLFSAYMNLDNIDALNSSNMEDKDRDSRASGTRMNESSENEVESSSAGYSAKRRDRGKRSDSGDIAPTSRHSRSLSMDSFMGNLNFSDESPKLPPSPGIQSAQHSPTNSMDGNNSKIGLEFGSGEFSASEMKKIMANDKLAELAMVDPKRVKRILANRQSAARSKERKLRYISELEHKVQTLQTEATTLSAQLTLLQRDLTALTNQNNELRFRLQAMEQEAQLRDALNEALTAEIHRLKLSTGELNGEAASSCSPPQFINNNQMFQMVQPSQYMYQSQQSQQPNNQKPQQQQQVEQPKQNQATKCGQDADATKS